MVVIEVIKHHIGLDQIGRKTTQSAQHRVWHQVDCGASVDQHPVNGFTVNEALEIQSLQMLVAFLLWLLEDDRRDPDAPSSARQGTLLLPLPDYASAALCASASDQAHQDTTVGDGTCLLLLARNHPWMAASHGHHDVFWALSAGTPMSRPAGVLEACTPSNHL